VVVQFSTSVVAGRKDVTIEAVIIPSTEKGIKGQAIHQRYMDMTYDVMGKDGNVKTLPLFGDINI
jgi:hypothetical protein